MDFWKTVLFVLLWRSGSQKNQRSSPTFHELWGLSADQEPVTLTLAEAIYGTLVACGKFISWSSTWRQSLSTLEAALVWTLSTFDGVLNVFEKDRFFFFLICPVGEEITEWQNVYEMTLTFLLLMFFKPSIFLVHCYLRPAFLSRPECWRSWWPCWFPILWWGVNPWYRHLLVDVRHSPRSTQYWYWSRLRTLEIYRYYAAWNEVNPMDLGA